MYLNLDIRLKGAFFPPYIFQEHFRTLNAIEGGAAVGSNLYAFDLRYQRVYSSPQLNEVQFRFSNIFLGNRVTGYALVLTKEKLSIDIDGQSQFDLKKHNYISKEKQICSRKDPLLAATFIHKNKFKYMKKDS